MWLRDLQRCTEAGRPSARLRRLQVVRSRLWLAHEGSAGPATILIESGDRSIKPVNSHQQFLLSPFPPPLDLTTDSASMAGGGRSIKIKMVKSSRDRRILKRPPEI